MQDRTALEQADIVLLTVNDHETEQVQRAFHQTSPAVSVGGRSYWDYGEIGGSRVVHTMTNMGDVATIRAVQDAAEALRPVLFLAVGIAWGAGLEGQHIGDLLLANPLRDAAHHKDDAEKGIRPRGHHFELDDSLLQNLKTHHRDWVRQQPEPPNPEPVDMGDGLWRNPRPQLLNGLVLSLPVLIDNQTTRDRLLAAHPGAIGGEMEGRGLGFAALAGKCDLILIKAICDWAAAKNADKAQKERDQQLAATRAADFVRYAVERSLGPWAVHARRKRQERAGGPAPPERPTLDSEVTRYYQKLARACDVVTAQDHYPSANTPSTQSTVEDVYVEPDVWVRPLKSEGTDETAAEQHTAPSPERRPWQSCFNSDEQRFQRIALLAEGGMGKTTAVDREIQRLCDGHQPWLALRLPLLLRVDQRVPRSDVVEEALTLDIMNRLEPERPAAEKIRDSLLNHLNRQAGVLLFDGFDEVPLDRRPEILNSVLLFVSASARKQSNHKVVLTSRPYATDNPTVQSELARHGFETLHLAPLSPEQQAELVMRYFAVEPRPQADGEAVGRALVQQLQVLNAEDASLNRSDSSDGKGLAALMCEPMLATYACMLAEERTRSSQSGASTWPLPTSRHELLDGVVELLLEKWDVKRRDSEQTTPFACLFEPEDDHRSRLRRLVEEAAIREHLHVAEAETARASGYEGQLVPELPADWQLQRLYEAFYLGQAQGALTADWLVARIDRALPADVPVRAHRVAAWLTQRSGLMRAELRRRVEEPRMQHRQLADFLAAGAWGHDRTVSDHARALVEQAWFSPDWSRQMIELGFERVVATSNRPGKPPNTVALCDGLSHWQAWCNRLGSEKTALFTAVLAQALARAIPADWFDARGKATDPALDKALDPLRQRLIEMLAEQCLSAPERVAAADALGALGDPRFEPGLWLPKARFGYNTEAEEPLPGFVRVAAGPFVMGDKDDEYNPPTEALIESDFYIARCLTTVAQYSRFVAAGGYVMGNEVWGEAGLSWRDTEKRTQPQAWIEQKRFPHRPVTGVSWWEARAYLRWLNRDPEWWAWLGRVPQWRGYRAALPTERQWERAARCDLQGQAHRHPWPWGEGEDPAQRANVEESGVGRVSPVGCFAPNAFGVWDLAGNVLEWMDNAFEDAAHTADPLTLEYEAKFIKSGYGIHTVLRGGSWGNGAKTSRTSVRSGCRPDIWGNGVGFRVVLSLAEQNPDT